MTDKSLENYYYGSQLRRYILEYMAIFSGLQVRFGKNDFESQTDLVSVPIEYGSKDRVVAAILAENTQNKAVRVPALSANMIGIEKDDNLYVGSGQTRADTHLPLGSAAPDGLVTVKKIRPVPYQLRMETVVYASNSDQHCQMLEQILMLFNPTLQIQTSDDFGDWAKITTVTLDNIGFDETYPSGNDRRIITTTLTFSLPIQLSPPYNLTKDFIKAIKLRIQAVNSQQTVEVAVRESATEVGHDEDYETLIDIDDEDMPPT